MSSVNSNIPFEPLNDKVLIQNSVATDEEVTSGGLIIKHLKTERHYHGEVLAIGTSPDITVKPGDIVYYEKGVQYTIEQDDKVYDFVSCYDLVAKKTSKENK